MMAKREKIKIAFGRAIASKRQGEIIALSKIYPNIKKNTNETMCKST